MCTINNLFYGVDLEEAPFDEELLFYKDTEDGFRFFYVGEKSTFKEEIYFYCNGAYYGSYQPLFIDPPKQGLKPNNQQSWNDGSGRNALGAVERDVDDIEFVQTMIADIRSRLPAPMIRLTRLKAEIYFLAVPLWAQSLLLKR